MTNKSWKYNLKDEPEIGGYSFDFIEFKAINGQWKVTGYSFIECANPVYYGGSDGFEMSLEDFKMTKPEKLPDEVYKEMLDLI